MATKYLRGSATGAANGSSMASAYTTIGAACAGMAAGDTLLIANDHNELPGVNISAPFPGTIAMPNLVQSVDPVTEVYSPGATIGTTGDFGISVTGHYMSEGVNWKLATGATTAASANFGNATNLSSKIRDSVITTPGFLNARAVFGNANGAYVELDNVTINSGNGNGFSRLAGVVVWKNSTPYIGSIPQYLCDSANGIANVTYDGCDLSAFSGKTLRQTASSNAVTIRLVNCKLPTSFAVFSARSSRQDRVSIVNCSDASGALRREEHGYAGASTLVTNVYRMGGAGDAGASYSNRLASNADTSRIWPLQSLDLAFNVAAADVSVAKTLTAFLLTDAGVMLAASEAWIEIDYLGDSTSLDSAVVTSGPTDGRAVGTAPFADGASTWISTGLTSPVQQKVSRNFTPAKAGMHRARVVLARASTTLFVDLKMVLS